MGRLSRREICRGLKRHGLVIKSANPISVSASDEQPMMNKKSQSNIRTPFDEGGFGFRSPLQALKENFWPQKGKMKNVPLD